MKTQGYFLQLSVMLKAGLSVLQSCKQLYAAGPAGTIWKQVQIKVESGSSFSQALRHYKLVTAYQYQIIYVAEQAGILELAFKDLAHSQQLKQTQVNLVKSQLRAPLITLLVSFLVTASLSISSGQGGVLSIAVLLLAKVVMLWVCLNFLYRLLKKDSQFWLNMTSKKQQSPSYHCVFQGAVFKLVYWQAKAGLDYQQNFINAAALVSNTALAKKLTDCAKYCQQGQSVQQAMINSRLPLSNDFLQQLHAGEQAGCWHQALEHALKLNQQQLQLLIKAAIRLLLAICYSLVVLQVLSVLKL